MAKIIEAATLDDALHALSVLAEKNEARGEKTLVFCEDKLTLLAERAVLAKRKGTFFTEVSTFARFLSGKRVISKEGSVMLLSALLEEHQGALCCFSVGSARAVYETLAQLAASRIDGETLKECASATEGALKGKLLDLAFLYDKYREKLDRLGLLDESGYLSLLPEKLSSPALFETHVVFFGFPSFTKQAREGIEAARDCAKSLTGIFLAGREEFYTNEGASVFSMICKETGEPERERYSGFENADAWHLAKGLFSPERLSSAPVPTDKIRRFTAADEEEELSVVASLIKMYVAKGMRYRDLVVLTAGEKSLSVLEKVFGAYKIPYFTEKKRPFSGHPFSKFVLSALAAVSGGPLPDDADALASNYYFGEGGAEYRNYLYKFGGYRGAVKQKIKDTDTAAGFDRENLLACRERMLEILSLFPKKGTGETYARAVLGLFELVGGEEKTQKLQEFFTGAEREFLKISPLESILSEIVSVAGERTFTVREFAKTLENGMKALEISMIPPSSDAVFAGDLTDAKFARARVVFATGLTDEIPRTCPDTAVLTDGEMERLKPLKAEIEPSIRQVNARARESLTLNLCAFCDNLYLSYPLKKDGKETARGEVLESAEQLFKMPPMPELFPYDCCEEQPAALQLLSLKNYYASGLLHEREKFNALYALFEDKYGKEETERLTGFHDQKEQVPWAAEKGVSPTLLEKYFECPYAGFVGRALALKEREERTVLDTDTGSFIHAVLEACAKSFDAISSEEELLSLARSTGEALLKSPRYFSLLDTDAGRYTAERFLSEAEEVTKAAFRTVSQSEFRVQRTEGKIALPELFLGGKADRIDRSDEYVRVIDYKTGDYDDTAAAYYTGRKLQLELYLRAASKGGKAAGAFYFPAKNEIGSGAERWRMGGFFSAEDEVLRRMDKNLRENEKSLFFEGTRNGKYTDKGMRQEDFETFLDYSVLVVQRAEREISSGNIAPTPYDGACLYCKYKSLCGFTGTERKEENVRCAQIVSIVRRERGDE